MCDIVDIYFTVIRSPLFCSIVDCVLYLYFFSPSCSTVNKVVSVISLLSVSSICHEVDGPSNLRSMRRQEDSPDSKD